jgi:hypothetical protein
LTPWWAEVLSFGLWDENRTVDAAPSPAMLRAKVPA